MIRESLKWEFNILYMILAELIFYGSLVLVMVFVLPKAVYSLAELYSTLAVISRAPPGVVDVPSINMIGVRTILLFLLTIVLMLAAHAACKGTVWRLVSNQGLKIRQYALFFLLNLSLVIIFVLLYYGAYYSVKTDFLLLFMLVSYFALLHYANIASALVFSGKRWLRPAFSLYFKPKWLGPYGLMIGVLIVLLIVTGIFSRLLSIRLLIFLIMLLAAGFSVWSKRIIVYSLRNI